MDNINNTIGNINTNNNSSNTSVNNNASDESTNVVLDKTLPQELDTQVPQKEELYGQEALLAEAGIDKNGYMRLDKDAVLDLNSPKLQVIKTLPNGKKVIMSVEEYNREKYMKDVTDEELASLDEKLKKEAPVNNVSPVQENSKSALQTASAEPTISKNKDGENANNTRSNSVKQISEQTQAQNVDYGAKNVERESNNIDSNETGTYSLQGVNKSSNKNTGKVNEVFTAKDIPSFPDAAVKDAIPDVNNIDVFAIDSVENNSSSANIQTGPTEAFGMAKQKQFENNVNVVEQEVVGQQQLGGAVNKQPLSTSNFEKMQAAHTFHENMQLDHKGKHIPGIEEDPSYLKYEDDPEGVPKVQPTEVLDPGLARYKILIIEDNSDVRYQYEFILKREGFTVITAKNGEEGITMAVKERPQLILLDILMPEVDGWEVLKALRQYTSTYKPRIMIISNLGAPEDIQKAYNLGADMFVIKADTTLQQVVEKVKKILKSTDKDSEQPLLIPLPKSSEMLSFLKQNLPELTQGVCPECGGPLGLKLIPQRHKDTEVGKVVLDFNARIVCLRCGKEWV